MFEPGSSVSGAPPTRRKHATVIHRDRIIHVVTTGLMYQLLRSGAAGFTSVDDQCGADDMPRLI
jgi:hypothetical protein